MRPEIFLTLAISLFPFSPCFSLCVLFSPALLPGTGWSQDLVIPESAVMLICERYTREPGVRRLEQLLAAVCRAAVVRLAGQVGVPPVLSFSLFSHSISFFVSFSPVLSLSFFRSFSSPSSPPFFVLVLPSTFKRPQPRTHNLTTTRFV